MVIRSGDGGSIRDNRMLDEMDDDRSARHISTNTSSVRSGHARNHSGASSSYSSHGSHSGKPAASWKDAFHDIQNELGPKPTSATLKVALLQFLKDLPPFYATAAADFVKSRREQNQLVNLDALGDYFLMLDQSAAEARKLPQPPPYRSSRSPGSKRSSPLSMSIKASPRSPGSPDRSRSTAPPADDHDHFVDFAPSRPHVSNLLLSNNRDE